MIVGSEVTDEDTDHEHAISRTIDGPHDSAEHTTAGDRMHGTAAKRADANEPLRRRGTKGKEGGRRAELRCVVPAPFVVATRSALSRNGTKSGDAEETGLQSTLGSVCAGAGGHDPFTTWI